MKFSITGNLTKTHCECRRVPQDDANHEDDDDEEVAGAGQDPEHEVVLRPLRAASQVESVNIHDPVTRHVSDVLKCENARRRRQFLQDACFHLSHVLYSPNIAHMSACHRATPPD